MSNARMKKGEEKLLALFCHQPFCHTYCIFVEICGKIGYHRPPMVRGCSDNLTESGKPRPGVSTAWPVGRTRWGPRRGTLLVSGWPGNGPGQHYRLALVGLAAPSRRESLSLLSRVLELDPKNKRARAAIRWGRRRGPSSEPSPGSSPKEDAASGLDPLVADQPTERSSPFTVGIPGRIGLQRDACNRQRPRRRLAVERPPSGSVGSLDPWDC